MWTRFDPNQQASGARDDVLLIEEAASSGSRVHGVILTMAQKAEFARVSADRYQSHSLSLDASFSMSQAAVSLASPDVASVAATPPPGS